MMKRALLSVWDKTGVVDFATKLHGLGYELLSTGGTHKALEEAGLPVTAVSDVTGFPECLDGRVKTLHPAIMGGLLAMRGNEAHMEQLSKLEIAPIDLLVCNLYPFKQTVLKPGVTFQEAIENIDIGGPSMLRAAAKNHQDVAVITDPADYDAVIAAIEQEGQPGAALKRTLAAKVFAHTAHYDCLIAEYLADFAQLEAFPQVMTMTFEKAQDMRYGENPHQNAAYYTSVFKEKGALANSVQLHGKPLSFNNINDTQGALALLKEFDEPTVVAVKHATPCGVGSADAIYDAYMKAYEADKLSIFGGIVAANRPIDAPTAKAIHEIFVEIVIAPGFDQDALDILTQKKNIRLLQLEDIQAKAEKELDMKKVSGGLLLQEADNCLLPEGFEPLEAIVSDIKPTPQELEDLQFALKIVKHAKSNAIVLAKNKQSVGIGGGQVNRLWATKQAIEHGMELLGEDFVKGAVLASDGFFPFADCVEEAAKAGITAIVQPGGSMNDQLSVEACKKHQLAMMVSNMRHFKH